jgi:5-methylcytosine-specific restriction endonuclease McrA
VAPTKPGEVACLRARPTNKRSRAAGGQSFTAAEWLALLAHHGGACAYCGSKLMMEIDHRTPLGRGGSNLIENILPACRRCNRRKHLMTEEEFRAFLQHERAQGLGDGLDGNAGTTRS